MNPTHPLQRLLAVLGLGRTGQSHKRSRRRPSKPSARLAVTRLEDRMLLSVRGVPQWLAEGPAPILHGAANGNNTLIEGAGATEAIAVDANIPNIQHDPNNVYLGTTDGGIWHTTTALRDPALGGPGWVPQTDNLPGLSIGALTFAPWDTSAKTLFAGTADWTSFLGYGTPLVGLLRTTNAGNTWTVVNSPIAGINVWKIAATTDDNPNDQVVLVATDNGAFRSTDAGDHFQPISGSGAKQLPGGVRISDLAVDPLNPKVVYAAVPKANTVYASNDAGATWGALVSLPGSLKMIRLALFHNGQDSAVFAATLDVTGLTSTVFKDDLTTAQVLPMPAPPAQSPGNGALAFHLSIAADPNNSNAVYLGTYGNGVFYDVVGAAQPQQVNGSGPENDSPHPDSRALVFDAGNLYESDDGGIWRLSQPSASSGTWLAMDGSLQTTEVFSTAYDGVRNLALGAAQDNDTFRQNAATRSGYTGVDTGDGQQVAVDNTNPNAIVEYHLDNNLGGFETFTFPPPPKVTQPHIITLASAKTPAALFSGLSSADVPPPNSYNQTPFVLNALNKSSLLLAGTDLYESVGTRGDLITDLRAQIPDSGSPEINGPFGGPLAYGGQAPDGPNNSLVRNASVILVGYADGFLFLRTGAPGTAFRADPVWQPSNGTPVRLVFDPLNWHTAAVVTAQNGVWLGTHIGQSGEAWTPVTGHLDSIIQGNTAASIFNAVLNGLDAVEVVDVPAGSQAPNGGIALLVGGSNGLYETLIPLNAQNVPAPPAVPLWGRFSANLPNAILSDLHYDQPTDTLVVGTYGRGIWELPRASTFLVTPWTLQVNNDLLTTSDVVRLVVDPYNPNLVDVFQNNLTGTPNASVPLAFLKNVVVNGNGGTQSLTLDFSNGNPIPAGGLDFRDAAGGTLALENNLPGTTAFTKVVVTATGSGTGSISLDGSTVTYEGIQSVQELSATSDLQYVDGNPSPSAASPDTITFIGEANNPFFDDLFFNNTSATPDLTLAVGVAAKMEINGNGVGNAFTLDFSHGSLVPAGGLTVDGVGGSNSLTIQGGPTVSAETYTYTAADAGTLALSQTNLTFAHTLTITDTVGARSLTYNANPSSIFLNDSDIGGSQAVVTDLFSSIDLNQPFALLAYANKQGVTINGGNKDARILIDNRAARGLTSFTVNAAGTSGASEVDVEATAAPTTVVVGGTNVTVNVGNQGTQGFPGLVSAITGTLTLQSNGGPLNVNVDDSTDPANNRTVNIDDTQITGLAPNVTINYASGRVNNLSIAAGGGSGTDTFNITRTQGNTALTTGKGTAIVNVGNSTDGFQDIKGKVTVAGAGPVMLTLDDAADKTPQNLTVGGGSLTGLAPNTTVDYSGVKAGSLLIKPGLGTNLRPDGTIGNLIVVNDTPAALAPTINSIGPDAIFVAGTTGALTIASQGQINDVVVGQSGLTAPGNLANVKGNVTLTGGGFTQLTIDDSGDPASRDFTVNSGSVQVALLGTITFSQGGVSSLILDGGIGIQPRRTTGTFGDFFLVNNTPSQPTTINANGITALAILATTGSLTVNGNGNNTDALVGTSTVNTPGTLANILGGISFTNTIPATTLTVDDGADPASLDITVSSNGLSIPKHGAISYEAASTQQLTINGGLGMKPRADGSITDTFFVIGTPTGGTTINDKNGDTLFLSGTTGMLTVNGNGQLTTVFVGSPRFNKPGTLANLKGQVTLNNTNKGSTLTVDDSGDANPLDLTLDHSFTGFSTVAVGTLVPLRYDAAGLVSLTVKGGTDTAVQPDGTPANVFHVKNTPAGPSTTITDNGSDAVFVTGTTGPLTIDGNGHKTVVVVGGTDFQHTGDVVNLTGDVANIKGDVTVQNATAGTNLSVDDGTGSAPFNVTVGLSSIPLPSLGMVHYTLAALSALAVVGGSGGSGGNSITVDSNGATDKLPTKIFAGTSKTNANTVTVNVYPRSGYNLTVTGGPSGKDVVHVFDKSGTLPGNLGKQGSIVFKDTASCVNGAVSGTATVTYSSPAIQMNPPLVSTVQYVCVGTRDRLPDDNRSFIQALYHTALQRNGSPDELDYWDNVMQGAGGRQTVLTGIEESREARTLLVQSWYQRYLGRAGVGGEEQGWVDLLVVGLPEQQVLAGILSSPEYYEKAGSADGSFIAALYHDLLGREASADELIGWDNTLRAAGAVLPEQGRFQVAFLILASQEYRADQIASYYSTLLQRDGAPSTTEVDSWLLSALTLTQIREGFESSAEFYS